MERTINDDELLDDLEGLFGQRLDTMRNELGQVIEDLKRGEYDAS